LGETASPLGQFFRPAPAAYGLAGGTRALSSAVADGVPVVSPALAAAGVRADHGEHGRGNGEGKASARHLGIL
jgi:hypothetical protein